MNFCSLSSKKCIPCETKIPPLNNEKIEELKKQLHPDWKVIENKKLQREWIMKDFKSGIQFFQDIMKIAEEEQHHPDLHLVSYNKTFVDLYTHSIDGLSENDFIVASKIDQLNPILKKSKK